MTIFISPHEQIENVRKWNKARKWGIEERAFDQLPSPPAPPSGRFPLATVVLVPYLRALSSKPKKPQRKTRGLGGLLTSQPPMETDNSTHRTCVQLARLMKVLCPTLDEHLSSHPQSHLLPNVDEPEPGLRWETLDFDANVGQDPNDCTDRDLSPHAGVLAAACHFPKWVELIDKEELPGVWIVGYAGAYKIALFRNHDSRVSKNGVLELQGYSPGMGCTVGNRASRPLATPRFR